MKKLLFITTRLFFETDSGRKISLYHYCRGLAENYGYEIYLYSFLEPGQSEADLAGKPDFIRVVRLAKKVGGTAKMKNILLRALLRGEPLQTALFYSRANLRAIRSFAEEIRPDAVMVDMIRLAPYYRAFGKLPAKKILDLDDLLSRRYERERHAKNGASVLGASAGEVSSLGKRLVGGSFIRGLVLRSESRRTARAEKKWGRVYDSVIFVSERETDTFNTLLGKKKAHTVTLGVDYGFYSDTPEEKEPATLAFLGNFRYAPNADAMEGIARDILPGVNPPYTLHAVGGADPDFTEKYKDNPAIVFHGRVDDLRSVVGKCRVFLAPIPYGSGIKTKILEAMAMGLPVVTTTVGAEGLSVTSGKELFICDTKEEITDTVNRLLADEDLCRKTGQSAKAYIRDNHTWEIAFRAFAQMGL